MQHRRSRALRRGITHFELLSAIALLALVGGGIGVVVKPGLDSEKVTAAEQDARRIRDAIERWSAQREPGCPTLSQLVFENHLEPDAATDDPWGSRYQVECRDDEVVISSAGRDGQPGTADDVRVTTHRG
jgi:hypothetical protein